MSNVPAHLPGDLGEHDPRREAHPHGNEPGSGGHEVKLNSNEAKGLDSGATAAENSQNNDPRTDNTAEHALEGGSTETMDRQKRQNNSSIPGGRTGDDGIDDHLTRGGYQQQSSTGYDSGLTGNQGSHHHHHHNNHHGSTGSGLTGGLSQSGNEPISGVRGAGVGGAPYDAGNFQSSGFSGSDPQERHQTHHGDVHHEHDFSHNHNTRTGELLDPASGRDTGIPGYAGGASGLTGSNTADAGYGQTSTGYGQTGTGYDQTGAGYGQTGTGLSGSTGYGQTGAGYGQTGSTGERLREDVREGERAVGAGSHNTYGSTGSGLTGSSTTGTGYGQTGYGETGTGYGQTGSTGDRLGQDVREGERAVGAGHHGTSTGSHETTGERVKDDVREGERATGHHDTTEHKKPSLLDKLNPMKDSDGDGKKGFMK